MFRPGLDWLRVWALKFAWDRKKAGIQPAKPVGVTDMVEKTGEHSPEGAIFIGAGVELKGEMTVPGFATVDGRFEGALNAKSLVVGQTGHVSGEINVEIAEVRGTVGNNLVVRSRLVVRSSGAITGSCSYSKIMVEEGGELSGSIEKIAPAAPEQKIVSIQRGD